MISEVESIGPPDQRDWGARGTAGVSFAAALVFEGVVVELGGNRVLDDFNLTLSPGEVVCLLGESGSGKSTALRVAAGIQPISAGRVLINDRLVDDGRRRALPEARGVGLMFQDFALFPHMSLLDNVAFGLGKLGRSEGRRQAMAALRRVGLDNRAGDYPHMLSGGQQQRLALARSVAPRPGILLLDEPFSGLDARMREEVRSETLAILRETHATTIIVTHDPEEAMLLGDRIALLSAGKVVQVDRSEDIYHAPSSLQVARFFSNLSDVPGVVRGGRVGTPLGDVPAPGRADGAKVQVVIRPVGSLILSAPGDGVAGRVVGRREALGTEIYEIRVDGVDGPIEVRQQIGAALQPGSDVGVKLNAQHVLVFDAD